MRPPALTLPLTAWLILCGCGYIGDPLPPALNMPQKVTDLRVVESGESIVVEFTAPDRTTEDLPLTRLGEIELRMGPGGARAVRFRPVGRIGATDSGHGRVAGTD